MGKVVLGSLGRLKSLNVKQTFCKFSFVFIMYIHKDIQKLLIFQWKCIALVSVKVHNIKRLYAYMYKVTNMLCNGKKLMYFQNIILIKWLWKGPLSYQVAVKRFKNACENNPSHQVPVKIIFSSSGCECNHSYPVSTEIITFLVKWLW